MIMSIKIVYKKKKKMSIKIKYIAFNQINIKDIEILTIFVVESNFGSQEL